MINSTKQFTLEQHLPFAYLEYTQSRLPAGYYILLVVQQQRTK